MKGLIGLLVTAALGVGIYLYSLKMASPGPGMVATQAISTTGVQNDLIGIAQAERMYFAQNSTYADQIRSEEHTSELQSRSDLVCRLLLEKKKNKNIT